MDRFGRVKMDALFSINVQVKSGFFHESDSKAVAKSIRDRVALIKKTRDRRQLGFLEERRDSQSKLPSGLPLLQPQGSSFTTPAQPSKTECEETEVDQHVRQQVLQQMQHSSSLTGNEQLRALNLPKSCVELSFLKGESECYSIALPQGIY